MSNNKTNRLEGNGASRMVQMMKRFGHNEDVKFHVALVKSVSPFAIRLQGDNFDITDDLLIVSQAVLPHERQVKITGQATLGNESGAFTGDTLTLTYNEGYINVNDEVIVVETNDGQRYIVLEKVGG